MSSLGFDSSLFESLTCIFYTVSVRFVTCINPKLLLLLFYYLVVACQTTDKSWETTFKLNLLGSNVYH